MTQVDNFLRQPHRQRQRHGDDKIRAQAAAEPGCRLRFPAPGDALDWGAGVEARVLNSCPDVGGKAKSDDVNNCSIAIKLTYAGASILLNGRRGRARGGPARVALRRRPARRPPQGGPPRLLLLLHRRFPGQGPAQTAYISLGAGNSYGHPHQVALDRLQGIGAKIRRTDLEGTMSISLGRAAPALAFLP